MEPGDRCTAAWSEGRSGAPAIALLRLHIATRLDGSSDTPGLDADLLLGFALGLTRSQVIARGDQALSSSEIDRIERLVQRRLDGEPVSYITGLKAFRMIDLHVDSRVLVPRPETEEMVDIALRYLRGRPGALRVIDVGTGSGAIALSLAAELEGRDEAEVVAGDISQKALDVAAINRERLGLEMRVKLVRSDLLAAIPGRFDLVLANLPYLRDDQRHPSTAREPDEALYAGEDGLDAYRRLLPQVSERLRPGGLLICEIDPSQAEAILDLARGALSFPAAIQFDLSGRARFLVAGAVDFVRTATDTR